MSLIITKKFKRAKAQDSAAMDATPLHSSYNDPWWVEEAGKTVQALRNGGLPRKSIEELYAKIGRYTIGGGIPKLHSLAEKLNDLKFAVENNGNEGYKARQKAIGVAQEIMRVKTADSRAADARGTDTKFQKGDKVTVKTKWAGTRKGIVKEVINDPALKKAYVVEIEGAETAAYPAEIVSADACEDSAELNNDACGKGEDAKNDFANRIMPLVRKIADAQKVVEGVLSEAEELGYDAAHGEFPDSTFAKKSANQLEAACYEAVTALRKVKTIAVL